MSLDCLGSIPLLETLVCRRDSMGCEADDLLYKQLEEYKRAARVARGDGIGNFHRYSTAL